MDVADGAIAVVPLLPEHWAAVEAIHAQGIATGHATFETRTRSWDEWDTAHRPDCRFVAVRDGAVIGWAALGPVSTRDAYRGVAELSVYVDAECRGRGVGSLLLTALVAAAEAAGIWTLQAAVFPENEATLRLHAKHGFREVGRRERIARLHGRWRDTLLLERRSGIVG